MNKGMLTIGIILLSLIALLMVNVLTNFSTGGELDYYLVKETVDASLKDAIDNTYLRTCGTLRIDKEKFVESFLYRFADSVDATRSYDISFYDINEVPPKVSVIVNSETVLAVNAAGKGEGEAYKNGETGHISTQYDAIIETEYFGDLSFEKESANSNSDLCKNLKQIGY